MEGDEVLASDRDVVRHYFLLVVSLSFRDLQSIKLYEMLTEALLRIKGRCGIHKAWISQLPVFPCVPPCALRPSF